MGMSSAQVILLLAVVVLGGWYFMGMPTSFQAAPGGGLVPSGGQGTPVCNFATATFTAETNDMYANTPITAQVEVWDSATNTKKYNATGANRATISTAAATTLSGYMMIGNDDYADRGRSDAGTEYYYVKVPFAYGPCAGTFDAPMVDVPAEGTATMTGYDNGAVEATTNITIGSGATVTTTKVRIEASSDACLGNPTIDNSFGICFNHSTPGLWDEIRPDNYIEKFADPSFTTKYDVLECYVIGPALCDYEAKEIGIVFDAAASQDPGITHAPVGGIVMDKTYYLNDNMVWVEGWGLESNTIADTEIGLDGAANAKFIYLA